MPQKRHWYQQMNSTNHKDTKLLPIQFPRSRWDSEDEETSSILTKEEIEIEKPINKLHVSLSQREWLL